MRIYFCDFETKSSLNLTKKGTHNYLENDDADIVCLGYKKKNCKAELWVPGDSITLLKDLFQEDSTLYFHNAYFDWKVWNMIGVKKYNFPELKLNRVVDSMALCGRYNLPLALTKVGRALNLEIEKDSSGIRLIKKICQPPFDYTEDELSDFYSYCLTDVKTLESLVKALPVNKLEESEQALWTLTVEMNEKGLPIDTKSAKQILKLIKIYAEDQQIFLPELTTGAEKEITKATQVQRITNWVRKEGYPLDNLQAPTVQEALDDSKCPNNIKKVLKIRQAVKGVAIAKFTKMLELVCKDNRIRDNLMYYGASTGRWTGKGFQIHNLPRASVKNPEKKIEQFFDLSIIEKDPVQVAKALVRPMVSTVGLETTLIAIDYSQIENRLLHWAINDESTLNIFRSGKCQYKDMASYIFKVPYDSVTDEQRQVAKPTILGCQYGLAHSRLKIMAKGYGVELSIERSKEIVKLWRIKNSKVVDFWYKLKDAAVNATLEKNLNKHFKVYDCDFYTFLDRNGNRWLALELPSKRTLFYKSPELADGLYGLEVHHKGINPNSKNWGVLRLGINRLVENIVQALARDILAYSKLLLDARGYKILASIHDEVLLEMDLKHKFKEAKKIMCIVPLWAEGLPLAVEGYVSDRFKKA